jgi:hypothetical protein
MRTRLAAEYWRERAEEARAHAEQMQTQLARKTLLNMVENYDQLAEQAERLHLELQIFGS